MKLPTDQTKKTAQFRFVEVAKFVPSLDRIIREKKDGLPVLIDVDEIQTFAKANQFKGIFQSVFQYDSKHLDSAASLGPLYFDIDSNDIAVSKDETTRLVNYLLSYFSESAVRVYFSGQKGFHIECEAIALALGPSDDLPGIFRFIAKYISDELKLEGTDLVVYDRRRMWRVPNTIHQRTGLYKVECMQLLRDSQDVNAILKLAEKPRDVEVPEQVHESKAIKWFGELKGEYEDQVFKAKSFYSNFENFLHGGTNYHSSDMSSRVFTSEILDKCSAVKSMYDKVRTEHYLNHYERLFLCSLFTYNEQAVDFLHKEFLAHCEDYNFQISDNHVKDWIRRRENGRGGRPFTCEKAKEVGIMCQDCDKLKPARRKINGYLIEEEVSPSPVRLAYIDINRKEFYGRGR